MRYRTRVRLALVLLVVTGCGDNTIPRDPDSAISGARLRVIRHVFDDGTRQLETEWLHDRARDERCAPAVWSDGARYCTPSSEPAVFVDATCTLLVGKAPVGTTPAYFRREYVQRGQPLPSRLYEARDRAGAPPFVWQLLDGQCIGPWDADPNADYFGLGPEITSAAFVRVAKTESSTGGTRLVHSVYTSDDGLQLPITRVMRDPLLDVDCAPAARSGAEHATCVPAMPLAAYFRDDGCDEPVLAIRSSDERPTFVMYPDASACPRYAAIGDAIALPEPFRRTAAGCERAIASNDDRFYAIGAELDLVRIERSSIEEAGHRLARIELRDGDRVVEDARLVDTDLAIECERVPTPEGDRCLPAAKLSAEREPTFRDDLCSEPLALVLLPAASCEIPTHVADGAIAHALTSYTGAIYHLSTGDRCLPYSIAGTAQSYELGPSISLAAFAGATIVID